MRTINSIVIHCSATPEGMPVTVESIDRHHKSLGWKGIGYHYVIYLDGSVHKGRDDKDQGSHAAGYNRYSLGVCYIGGLDKNGKCKDTRTEAQKKALLKLVKELKAKYPSICKVVGHNELPNVKKCCPCFSVMKSELNI